MKCLDATFLIDLSRKDPQAIKYMQLHDDDELCTTVIAVHELLDGFFFRGIREVDLQDVIEWLEEFNVLPMTLTAAISSSRLSAMLRREGKPIDEGDSLIAGTMLAHGCTTIITRDSDFKRIKGIKVETY